MWTRARWQSAETSADGAGPGRDTGENGEGSVGGEGEIGVDSEVKVRSQGVRASVDEGGVRVSEFRVGQGRKRAQM